MDVEIGRLLPKGFESTTAKRVPDRLIKLVGYRYIRYHVIREPQTPSLISPSDNTTFNAGTKTVSVSWNPSDGTPVVQYELEYADNASFDNSTIKTVSAASSTINVTDGDLVYWRVRAFTYAGGQLSTPSYSAFSTTRSFSVLTLPFNVTITGPTRLMEGEAGTWLANTVGGISPYSYQWSYWVNCPGIDPNGVQMEGQIGPDAVPCDLWTEIGYDFDSVLNDKIFPTDRSTIIKVVARDQSGSSVSDTHTIWVSGILNVE